MIFSVWNQGKRAYDYFETPAASKVNAPAPSHISGSTALGASPDDLNWPLPSDAVPTGSGKHARGKIAARKSGLALGDFPGGKYGMLAAIGGLLLLLRHRRG